MHYVYHLLPKPITHFETRDLGILRATLLKIKKPIKLDSVSTGEFVTDVSNGSSCF